MTNEQTFEVPGMHCESCRLTIAEELDEVPGIDEVVVDLATKRVTVRGEAAAASVRAAIAEAGYDVA